jgi:hypothetical protein
MIFYHNRKLMLCQCCKSLNLYYLSIDPRYFIFTEIDQLQGNQRMWYVLVQEEQLGPMTFQEVLEFYYKDMITRENLVWRDGMAGWQSLDQTQEFIEVLFKGQVVTAVQPQVVPSFEVQKTPIESNPAIQAIDVKVNEIVVESTSHFAFPEDLFVPKNQVKNPTPMPQNPFGTLNTSGFESRSNQLNISQSPEPSRFSTPVPQNQDNGKVIDSALLSVFDQKSTGHVEIKKQKSKIGLYIGIAVVLAATVIFFVVVTQQDQTQDPNPEQKTTVSQTTTAVNPTPIEEIKPITTPTIIADQGVSNAQVPTVVDQGMPALQADALVITDVEINAEDVIDLEISEIDVQGLKTPKTNTQGIKKTNTTPVKTTTTPVNSAPKAILTRGDIASVVSQNQASITSCLSMDDSLKGTTQNVQIKIQKNGTVSMSQATSPKLRNSPAKACIENKIKALKFPAFTSEPMDVPLPLKF